MFGQVSSGIGTLFDILKYLLPAVPMTIYITVSSFIIALILGLIVAVGRVSRIKLLSKFFGIYTDVIRGVLCWCRYFLFISAWERF